MLGREHIFIDKVKVHHYGFFEIMLSSILRISIHSRLCTTYNPFFQELKSLAKFNHFGI